MAEGRIMSIESMGLVDGPGIRFVVFMQGCMLRCRFCHNPDSWNKNCGETISSDELMRRITRFRPYFERSGGGVTFSGGEPLLQKDFLLEMLKRCKAENIHTCLDTAGVGDGDYDDILSFTDLVLYDVKAIDKDGYLKMCGRDISETEEFQNAMKRMKSRVVVRQVVVPGINDNDEYMEGLSEYIKRNIPGTEKVELLPYHLLGEHKYKKLGIKEPLEGVPAMDADIVNGFYNKYFKKA